MGRTVNTPGPHYTMKVTDVTARLVIVAGRLGAERPSVSSVFGCLSPTEPLHRARAQDNPGARAFVRQPAWRDFHHQVLAARPDAATHD